MISAARRCFATALHAARPFSPCGDKVARRTDEGSTLLQAHARCVSLRNHRAPLTRRTLTRVTPSPLKGARVRCFNRRVRMSAISAAFAPCAHSRNNCSTVTRVSRITGFAARDCGGGTVDWPLPLIWAGWSKGACSAWRHGRFPSIRDLSLRMCRAFLLQERSDGRPQCSREPATP